MISDFRCLLRADPDCLARDTLSLAILVSVLTALFCLPGLA